MIGEYYKLRNGITVLHTETIKDNHMAVLVTQLPLNVVKQKWKVGEEHVLTAEGKGHMWGRNYDTMVNPNLE